MFSHCGRVWQYSEPERVRERVYGLIPGIEVQRRKLSFRWLLDVFAVRSGSDRRWTVDTTSVFGKFHKTGETSARLPPKRRRHLDRSTGILPAVVRASRPRCANNAQC